MRVMLALALSALALVKGDVDRVTASVTVAGGPHAGSYYLRNADVPCEITTRTLPGPKHLFDVTVGGEARNTDPAKLSLLALTIPDADVKGENHVFFASIIFGDVGHGTRYVVESRDGQVSAGSGVVTIATRGHDATVMFEVAPSSGVAYRGTILCTDVSRY